MEKQKAKRFGCLTRLAHFPLWLILFIGSILTAGFFYQRQTTAADFAQFPAPSQRVDVGGYSLHINCTGESSPTVVVDAGNADFSLSWHGIQPEVAKFTRICTYDRAGYRWSDPSPSRARQRRWLMVTEIVQRLYYQYAKVTVKCRIAPSR